MTGNHEVPPKLRKKLKVYAKRILRIKEELSGEVGGYGDFSNWSEKDKKWRDRTLKEITDQCKQADLDRNRLLEKVFREVELESRPGYSDSQDGP